MPVLQAKALPPKVARIQGEMEDHARRYGLDFFPTVFEVVDVEQLNAIAAYGGFPTRYPHWRFGMEFEQLAKGYAYGLQKIYELVVNNDPCYAYLLSSNSNTDHRMVIAHVYGHCDFFKNNYWFSQTNRKMIDEMANHGNRIRRYMDRFGTEEVEDFIDACLSAEDLIDIHALFFKRSYRKEREEFVDPMEREDEEDQAISSRFRAKDYMDRFINPPQVLQRETAARREKQKQEQPFPKEPVRDVMGFLLEHAPLRPWQADVLSIIRDEAYYFAPQGQTKIMNEGWATYWHSTIMTRHGITDDADIVSYADHTSGTLASSSTRLNPYKLGVELFRDIEDRWNRGCFGREYEECQDLAAKRAWNTNAGLGREKIFEVRRIHNDLTFIDEFLTLDFCRQHKLFSFAYNQESGYYEIESREFEKIKQRLLFSLTNLGRPIVRVQDGNYKNRGELYLKHEFSGPELHLEHARETLEKLHQLWRRPVHVETVVDCHVSVLSYDGTQHDTKQTKEEVEKESPEE
jgi:stage V sporulation protein R